MAQEVEDDCDAFHAVTRARLGERCLPRKETHHVLKWSASIQTALSLLGIIRSAMVYWPCGSVQLHIPMALVKGCRRQGVSIPYPTLFNPAVRST